MTRYDFFYDSQIRRFLLQVVRAFSGFQYQTGRRGNVAPQLKIVPVTMALRNRQVAAIRRNLSENVLNTVPMITVDMTNIAFDSDRLQNPNHVGILQVYERKIDTNGNYTNEMGNATTVERIMPRPFTITCQVDIWTSNMEQKHQLMEQILQIIYPTFDIQNSDNAVDWSALTVVHPKDITWSSISVPVGNEDQIDVATITLDIPIWLSPPARIKRQKVIEQIITNINQAVDDDGSLLQGRRLTQEITTPDDHWIRIRNGTVQLLGEKANEYDSSGNHYSWDSFFLKHHRSLDPATTQLRVRFTTEDSAPEIIGTLQEGANAWTIDWQIDVDTLPANTLTAINAIIDPLRSVPGHGLPVAALGQRYMLNDDLPENSAAWGGTAGARSGAIIEYQNSGWDAVFSGLPDEVTQFVLNLASGKQLRWTGVEWGLAIDNDYPPGFFRII